MCSTFEGSTDGTLDGKVEIDGEGIYAIDTGVKFLDHMLEQFAKNSLVNIFLNAHGKHHKRQSRIDVEVCMDWICIYVHIHIYISMFMYLQRPNLNLNFYLYIYFLHIILYWQWPT